jgi:hypothetical protein
MNAVHVHSQLTTALALQRAGGGEIIDGPVYFGGLATDFSGVPSHLHQLRHMDRVIA